jgi:hypothetical protein
MKYNYLLAENIHNRSVDGVISSARTLSASISGMAAIDFYHDYRQVLGALQLAEDAFYYRHNDLHSGNVMRQTVETPVEVYVGNDHWIMTDQLARIIDFGQSRVRIGQIRLADSFVARHVGSAHLSDAYKLLLFSAADVLNAIDAGSRNRQELDGLLAFMQDIYSFFYAHTVTLGDPDESIIGRALRRRRDRNDYYVYQIGDDRTYADLIAHVDSLWTGGSGVTTRTNSVGPPNPMASLLPGSSVESLVPITSGNYINGDPLIYLLQRQYADRFRLDADFPVTEDAIPTAENNIDLGHLARLTADVARSDEATIIALNEYKVTRAYSNALKYLGANINLTRNIDQALENTIVAILGVIADVTRNPADTGRHELLKFI